MSTQTCDCIRVTYQLEGEEPVTVEVESTDEMGDHPFYEFQLATLSIVFQLGFSGFAETWKLTDDEENLQAYLSADTPCPFGTYTTEKRSIFESFSVAPCETEEDKIINCYKLAVWSKQCEYSKCVLEYVNNLIFGVEVCKLQESLKEQKRALEILNCYDPRDITNNTTNYNAITYNTIKKLLNK